MPDLTKRESAYFIAFALASFAIMLGIIAWWGTSQPNCWSMYATEKAAIEACEK
jgi:hypothetical protein